jgi:hypothetical protein
MPTTIEDWFIALRPSDTRCPEAIHLLAPTARTVYILKQRFDCNHWVLVSDCFHQVKGAYIVTQPVAGRRYFTTKPKTVIARLQKAGVW